MIMSALTSESRPYAFMSFVDPDSDGKNIGCCVVKSAGMGAINLAHNKGCNPGGEVAIYQLTKEEFEKQGMNLDRLYTRDEMNKLGFGKD